MFHASLYFLRSIVLGAAVLLQIIVAASGQNLPNYVDPSAYEDTLDLSLITSIRFLTSADFPPFNFKDEGGDIVGFNVELAAALCKEIGADCTLQSWPWAQLPKALEDGQGDVIIAGLNINEENGRRFEFSQSYLQLPGRFVGRNTSASAVDFDPQKLTSVIGVQRGSAHFAFIKQHFPKMILLSFDSELDVFAGIEAGTIDFGFVDGMRASFWLNQNDCCGFFGGPYFSTEYFGGGLAVAVLPAKGDILRAINIGLRRLGERGKLDELYFKWFAVGFY
ncbi:MAG: polar amino acid transport system substrate-binding protein [Maritalea sp.]|jgi:polar amino acid transport system substrate-binding protein